MSKRVKEVLPEGTKRCTKCKLVKPVEGFNVCNSRKDGRYPSCLECRKKWYDEHIEEEREADRARYAADPEKFKAKNHAGYQKFKPERLASCARYRKEHPEEKKDRDRKYREENLDSILAKEKIKRDNRTDEERAADAVYAKTYAEANKESLRAKRKVYNTENKKKISARYLERYHSDPAFKAANLARNRLNRILGKGGKKAGSAIRDRGCSSGEWEKYFSGLLAKRGWTWKQHGRHGWHVDHIIPLCKFDLIDRKEFLKAVHYTNLQPLWWDENLKKGDEIPEFVPYYGSLIWKKFPLLYPKDKSCAKSTLRFSE